MLFRSREVALRIVCVAMDWIVAIEFLTRCFNSAVRSRRCSSLRRFSVLSRVTPDMLKGLSSAPR